MSFSPSIFHWNVCLECLFAWFESKSYWCAMSIVYFLMLMVFKSLIIKKYMIKDSWFPISLLLFPNLISISFPINLENPLTNARFSLWCSPIRCWTFHEFYRLHSPITWIFPHSIYSTWPSYPTKTIKQTLHLTTSLK